MLKGILVMSCIRPCVQLFMGLALCIADKSLGRNGQQIGMLMYPDDLCSAVIDNYGYYCLCVCLTVCWCFHLLGLVWWGEGRYTRVNVLGLGQRRAVVIVGRWLLPSLVDTGDICCHYWQHILVPFKEIHLTSYSYSEWNAFSWMKKTQWFHLNFTWICCSISDIKINIFWDYSRPSIRWQVVTTRNYNQEHWHP